MIEIVSRILYAVAMLCISKALVNHTNRLKAIEEKIAGYVFEWKEKQNEAD